MKRRAQLAAMNATWVLMLTINSRIVNARHSLNFSLIAFSQILIAFGYFTIVKSIQHSESLWDKVAFCVGGAAGAVVGVLITQNIA